MNWDEKYHKYINSPENIAEINRRLEEGLRAKGKWPGWEAIWDKTDLHPEAGRIFQDVVVEQARRFFSDPNNYKNRKKIKSFYHNPFLGRLYRASALVDDDLKTASLEKIAYIIGYEATMNKFAQATSAADKDALTSAGILGGVMASQIPLKAYVQRIMQQGVSRTDLATARQIARKYNLKIDYNKKLPPHYNPLTKKIYAGHGLPGTLHELGHARMYRRYGPMAKQMAALRILAPLSTSLAGTAMAVSDNDELSKNAPLIAAAGGLPVMLDEGIASALALKNMKQLRGWKGVGEGIRKLTPGFLSYLTLPAMAMVLPFMARGIKRKYNENDVIEDPDRLADNEDTAKAASQGYMDTMDKASAIIGYYETMQKAAAKGLTTASHSELALRPEVKPQRSNGPSISPSMGSLMGNSRSSASFAPAVAESTSTARPGSSFDFGSVRGAKIQPWTGDEIRAATPEEMMTSRSLGRPWYNPEAPRTMREAGTVAAEILSNLYAHGPSVSLRSDARTLEDFI